MDTLTSGLLPPPLDRRSHEGLYPFGAGTHPGAAMPGVLCSAKLPDRLIPPVMEMQDVRHG